jgi:hypothetical protein
MEYPLAGQSFDSAAAFVAAINKARLAYKNRWIAYSGYVNVNGAPQLVEVKSYNTGYLQILRVNGMHYPTGMDMNVTGWKGAILDAIERGAARAAA